MCEVDLSKAVSSLKNGGIIVYPTDTLYALGADIFNEEAVKKIFRIKKRSFSNPLPVAVSNINEINKIAFLDKKTKYLMGIFLPGPLTLVLSKKKSVSDIVTGGLDKVAVRIPANDIALELLSRFGPLIVTSANIHGEKTPGLIKDIKMQFKNKDIHIYLDQGRLEGLPSTIVDMTSAKPEILRKGVISREEILNAF